MQLTRFAGLNRTLIFDWYMARLVVKNGHHKHARSDEIEFYDPGKAPFQVQ